MSEEWKHASWVSLLGKWAWILVILNGIIEIIYNVVLIVEISVLNASLPISLQIPIPFYDIWNVIWGVIIILIGFVIIKPQFSQRCIAKDWDGLYNWNITLAGVKIPWMLIWGIIIEIFGFWGWGGLSILIPGLVLIFAGPKQYDWKAGA